MANLSELNYESIENPFDSLMEREGGLLGSPGMVSMGGGEITEETVKNIVKSESKEVEGQDLENLWISSWIRSRNYKPKTQGFLIDGKLGRIECMKLYVGTGGMIGGSLDIPNITTADSFHVETDGDTWWGCNVADWVTDNDNANAFILKTGNAKFQDITLEGLVILKDLQAGSVVEGEYINALAVGKLASGTILSKQISLGVTGGSGDAYISGGAGLDYTNWHADKGFILGLDDSDSDLAKFFIGDNANNKYLSFDGADMVYTGGKFSSCQC